MSPAMSNTLLGEEPSHTFSCKEITSDKRMSPRFHILSPSCKRLHVALNGMGRSTATICSWRKSKITMAQSPRFASSSTRMPSRALVFSCWRCSSSSCFWWPGSDDLFSGGWRAQRLCWSHYGSRWEGPLSAKRCWLPSETCTPFAQFQPAPSGFLQSKENRTESSSICVLSTT